MIAEDENPPVQERPTEIVLVGVGHVFDLRRPLQDLIHRQAPDAVLVELDEDRYQALVQDADQQASGLYGVLARFQEKAAESTGTRPGEEMLAAIEAGQQIGARTGLIDMDARVMFRRMWKAMSVKEKLKFLWAALTSLFYSEERIHDELEQFSDDYTDLMEAFAAQFPSAKEVLIDERDEIMASRIRNETDRFDRIVAVVGDGHIEGMHDRLDDLDVTTVRLKELVGNDPGENASVGFTVETG